MAEQRAIYRIIAPQTTTELAEQLNMILDRLSERLDQMEGYRGTPTFKASIEMLGNKIKNVACGVSSGEVLTADLEADAGLEVAANGVRVKVNSAKGINRDIDGLYVTIDPTGGLAPGDDGLIVDPTVVDHGELKGLADDDHTQYLKKIGTDSLEINDVNTTLIHGFIRRSF
jgi:hypothetical protein